MKILLVDDDQLDRQIVIRTLKKCEVNCDITEANTVDEGLSLYAKNKYDIVLLDYSMPQRNGVEMIIEIRNNSESYNTAIIMISSTENEDLATECLKAGAQDFLLKSEISEVRLHRALVHAAVRFDLEQELYASYQTVKNLAESDSLTGLSNRYNFDETLNHALKESHRVQTKVGLILFDLDNFKNVNDRLGHDTGDLLLKRVVSRITSCLRGDEHFSRLGGDEFAIILKNIKTPNHASYVAQRIIAVLQKPFVIDNHSINTSASIGISLFPDNGDSTKTLIKYADIAMYRAKKDGRNQVCFFEEAMQQQFLLRIQTEAALKHAITEKQFVLHYQPIINTASNAIEGFEALIRWQQGDILRSPDEFIEIAEETRLISEIGEWVINEAISTLARWNQNQTHPMRMAINVSAIQICEASLVTIIENCLKKYEVNADLIDIEITETALFVAQSPATTIIDQIHTLGCHVVLDDFGTGQSSISHLCNHPISGIKIDKSIMPSDIHDNKKIMLAHCLSSMAKTLGLSVVAEGIDCEFKKNICQTINATSMQGFYFFKPMPDKIIETLINKKSIPGIYEQ